MHRTPTSAELSTVGVTDGRVGVLVATAPELFEALISTPAVFLQAVAVSRQAAFVPDLVNAKLAPSLPSTVRENR